MLKRSLFLGVALTLILLGAQFEVTFGAPIEDALKSLKGLTVKERLARLESEARQRRQCSLGFVNASSLGRAGLADVS